MLAPANLDESALFLKRVIDVVVSTVLLVAAAPLFVLIAAAIKLTTPQLAGLLSMARHRSSGRPFTGYKFTTMVADADEQKQHLLWRNEMQGPVFKLRDDPRVTSLGRIPAKYSPQRAAAAVECFEGRYEPGWTAPGFRHELARDELWHKRSCASNLVSPASAGQRAQPHQRFRRVGAARSRIHRPLEPLARLALSWPGPYGRSCRGGRPWMYWTPLISP